MLKLLSVPKTIYKYLTSEHFMVTCESDLQILFAVVAKFLKKLQWPQKPFNQKLQISPKSLQILQSPKSLQILITSSTLKFKSQLQQQEMAQIQNLQTFKKKFTQFKLHNFGGSLMRTSKNPFGATMSRSENKSNQINTGTTITYCTRHTIIRTHSNCNL